MTFTHPQALWLLALALPVTLLHFYRGPRRRVPVPALRFWTEALADEGRTSALRRIRHHLNLALLLLAIGAMALALSGPDLEAWLPPARRVVVVVDSGPELSAGDRFAKAIAGARELLSRLGRRDRVALLDRSGVVESMGDAHRAADALRGLPRALPRLDRESIVTLAAKLAAGGEVFVFSSLAGPRVVPVGEPLDNTSLGAPTLNAGVLRVPLVRRARARGTVGLVLRDRGQVVGNRSLELDASESRVIEWPLDPGWIEAGLRVECAIDPPDAWPDDDRSTLVTEPTGPPTVALIAGTDPDPLLAGALSLLAKERVIRRVGSTENPSVRVYDGVDAPADASGGVLIAGAPGSATVEAPRIAGWVREAPFHRDVDYSDVRLKRAALVEGDALITSDKGPIASWSSRLGNAVIRLGFRFRAEDGDLALRPAFPIFLRQALQWLAGEGRRGFPAAADAGSALVNLRPLSISEGAVTVTTVLGASAEARTWPVRGSRVRIDVPVPGLLKIEAGRDVEWVALNDPAPGRVDLASVPPGSGPAFPARRPAWQDPPVAAIAAALSILALLAEWALGRAA